jgi:hypothetical protein
MGINSHGAVIIVMFMAMSGMLVASHTFYGSVLPDYMSWWESLVASWVLAFAWESTVVVTTTNADLLPKKTSDRMAICSGIMMLFFIKAFDINELSKLSLYEAILLTVQRIFVAILTAFISKIFAILHHKKWQERLLELGMPTRNKELELKLAQTESKLAQSDSKVVQLESRVIQLESELKKSDSEKLKLQAFREVYDNDCTCPYCDTKMENPRSLTVHKGKCLENPINKDKKEAKMPKPLKLNGHHHVLGEG